MRQTICFITVIFISHYLYAQENSIENAMNRQIQEIFIEDAFNQHIQIGSKKKSTNRFLFTSSSFSSFNEGWSRKSSVGLTSYQSIFEEENYSGSFEFAITKEINNYLKISSQLNVISLKGRRDGKSSIIYDPYSLYESNGDYFKSSMTELSLVFSGDLPTRLLSFMVTLFNDDFFFPKRFNIEYNIGVGIFNFHSIRYNSISNNYIYGYGYNDLEAHFETKKSFWDLPKSRTFIYGPSIHYELTKASTIYLSSIMRYADTPYLDADKGLGEGDRFRNISLGYIYSFIQKDKIKD